MPVNRLSFALIGIYDGDIVPSFFAIDETIFLSLHYLFANLIAEQNDIVFCLSACLIAKNTEKIAIDMISTKELSIIAIASCVSLLE